MKTRFLIAILLFPFTCTWSQGVFNPPNIGFENMDFSNWYLYTGTCCPGGKTKATTYQPTPVSGRHTITIGSTKDLYGGFPVVSPNGGNYSMRLGNTQSGSQAERCRYYLRVPAGLNNYSLIFRYAVVFQDPGHIATEQPRFEVSAFDSSSGNPITCVQFTFVASSKLPGFSRSHSTGDTTILYKPWTTASLDLSGYQGRTVTLDFATGDCNQGAHFGYAYLDLSCGLFAISGSVCQGNKTSTLTAPYGFETYTWCDSDYQVVANTQEVNVPTPAGHNKYFVIMKPYAGYGCPDTLTTDLYVSDLFVCTNPDTLVCRGKPVQLKDSVYVNSMYQPINVQWLADTSYLSCTNCLNPVATTFQNKTLFVLKATDSSGCMVLDTLHVTIKQTAPYIDSQSIAIMQCPGTRAYLIMRDTGNTTFTMQWYRNGVNIYNATDDTLIIPTLSAVDTGNYYVRVISACDTIFTNQTHVGMLPLPVIHAGSDTTLCNQALLRFQANGNFIDSIQWIPNALGNFLTPTSLSTTYQLTDTIIGTFPIVIQAFNQCTSVSDTFLLSLNSIVSPLFFPSDTIVCQLSSPFMMRPLNAGGIFSGDAMQNSIFDPVHPGFHQVKYEISYQGCLNSSLDTVIVLDMPRADFMVNPDSPFVAEPVTFVSTSQHATQLIWRFQNGKSGTNNSINTIYYADGIFKVQLIAMNGSCIDSITREIKVEHNKIWIPNAFSPNQDQNNDVFIPHTFRVDKGNMKIYDRWGELVYSSNDLSIGWDGSFKGKPCPDDVYFYIIQYEQIPGVWIEKSGTVTLIR